MRRVDPEAASETGAGGGRRPVIVEPWDTHNQALVDNVHPPRWVNPTPVGRYNLVVIGAGTAGLVAAIGSATLGARVALIERALLGGDCLNWGCVPSKALLRAARGAADVRDAAALGVQVPPGSRVDFPAVMERMRRLRAQISRADSVWRCQDAGVDVHLGAARFTGRHSIEVAGQTLDFAKALIATGARAAAPPIPGLAEAGFLTNETVFSLTALPRRLAVVGAGPVGCELSQAFARFGSEVVLLQRGEQILPREDPDAARHLERALRRDGIRLLLGCRIDRVERRGSLRILQTASQGRLEMLEVDEVLVATGRVPNVEGLGLEAAGVAHDPATGVRVNDRLRTSNPRIFAAGDVCSPLKFTHHADFQARIVIRNALFLGRARASALTVPWCTYTDPEVARVGLSEGQARARGIRVRVLVQALEEVDRAVLDGEPEGFVKLLLRDGTDRIVGATIVARHAGEMLPEVTLAIAQGIGLGRIARTVHPYPTQAEAIRKLGDAYARSRLTPWARRLLQGWLRWSR